MNQTLESVHHQAAREASTVGPRANDVRETRLIRRVSPDVWGVLFLLLSCIPLYWDRVRDGRHLARVDILTFFLPAYSFMGDQLRAGDIPGWNPYTSSGLPFLGDPEAGWGYVTAMLTFTFLPPLTALQTSYFIHVLVAGLGTYAFCRVTGLGVWGAVAAALAFEYGSVVAQLRALSVGAQMTAWIPLAILGVELAIQAETLRRRAIGWAIGGFAISQSVLGWTGQGSAYALLFVGLYVGLRAFCYVLSHPSGIVRQVVRHAVDGAALFLAGLGLAAGGLWIRIAANQDSLIAGGDYSNAVGVALRPRYLKISELFERALQTSSYYYVGATTLGLAALAFFLVRRDRWRISIYLLMGVVLVDLIVQTPLARSAWWVIPRFQGLHEHGVSRVIILLALPTALLAGSTVDAIVNWKGKWYTLAAAACIPLLVAAMLIFMERERDIVLVPQPKQMLVIVAIAIGLLALIQAGRRWVGFPVARIGQILVVFGLLAAIAWDPFMESFNAPLAARVQVLPPKETFATHLAREDTGGPGGFLQDRMDEEGPFRFFGYGPSILGTGEARANSTYHGLFREPLVVELLYNRSVRLRLHNVQGYNPTQNERYSEFLTAVNGAPQNYHDANIFAAGLSSPLLKLLNVRYIIVEQAEPGTYPEIDELKSKYPTVFSNDTVEIVEITDTLPHTWIVHDVVAAPREDVLGLMQAADFDPSTQAVIEGTVPSIEAPSDPAAEKVTIDSYEPDRIQLSATMSSPGLVVLSEVYARGWNVYVDGEPATLYPTDHALRGVAVPGGTHTIEFRYEPAEIWRGAAITATTSLTLLLLIVQPWNYLPAFAVRRQPKRSATAPSFNPDGLPVSSSDVGLNPEFDRPSSSSQQLQNPGDD